MEGQDQHNDIPPPTPSSFSLPFLLPPQTPPPPFLFTPGSSAPSSSLMTNPPLLEPNQVLPEIDWVSLLSAGTQAGGFGGEIDQNYKPNLVNNNNITGSGENINEGDREEKGTNSKRKVGGRIRRAASRPRFAFQTRSADDILDDGYRWRKYGQKAVKNSLYPRSYYRCTHHTCNVKKQVQRLSKDTSIVVTTYEGIHNHPCEKLMETLTPLLKQMQFLSRF